MLLHPIDTLDAEILPSGDPRMTIISSTLAAEGSFRMLVALWRATTVVAILFVMGVTGLLGLVWRAVVAQFHDPLISAVVVGAIMLSFLPFAVKMLTPGTRA